jgi:hypothetical protein
MDNSTVSAASPGKSMINSIQEGDACDSVHVSRVRLLLSDMKLHHDASDSEGYGTIKSGAFILLFTSDTSQFVAFASVPPATYDRVKFEIHQYDPLIDVSVDLTALADFITGDRNTVIIEGTAYINGVGYPFMYESRIIINEQEMFGSGFAVEAGKTYTVMINYSAATTFKSGAQVLDPRDPTNSKSIDAGIKAAIRASIRLS